MQIINHHIPGSHRHRIVITMEGGVIQDIENIPSNVTVEVRDYDVEGYAGDALCCPSGEPPFILSEWTGE